MNAAVDPEALAFALELALALALAVVFEFAPLKRVSVDREQ